MTEIGLQHELTTLAGKIDGKVAYCFNHPASKTRVERAAGDRFISASVIKAPILMEAFHQAEYEGLDWKQVIPLKASDKVGGSGVLNELHDGLGLTLRDLAELMIIVSDNSATNMLLERLKPAKVNTFLRNHGCTVTECVRKLYDMEAIRKGIHNYIGASEITDLLTLAAQHQLNSPKADTEMIEIMKGQQDRRQIPYLLPPEAVTATKGGSLDEVCHDCGIVYLPGGDWFTLSIFCGDLKGSEDAPARDDIRTVMAKMSLACYKYVQAKA
ncbi:MAG TPA: serine hydrolase [Armatimonadota bacterium]